MAGQCAALVHTGNNAVSWLVDRGQPAGWVCGWERIDHPSPGGNFREGTQAGVGRIFPACHLLCPPFTQACSVPLSLPLQPIVLDLPCRQCLCIAPSHQRQGREPLHTGPPPHRTEHDSVMRCAGAV